MRVSPESKCPPCCLFQTVPQSEGQQLFTFMAAERQPMLEQAAMLSNWCEPGTLSCRSTLRGMGETRQSADSDDFFRYFGIYESAMTALLTAKPLVGMRALDIQRGVDLLSSRSDVDPQRISAFGKEKGAVPTLFAALLDTRIKKTRSRRDARFISVSGSITKFTAAF